jgi:hypothetical protein
MKRLRQGQTIYYVDKRLYMGPGATPELVRYFLHSHKTPLPPLGTIIEKLPVTHAREAYAQGFKFYTSRRKAERALRSAHA